MLQTDIAKPRSSITKAELARQLGVSRTYITLLCQGKRQPGREIANKLAKLQLAVGITANGEPDSQLHGPLAQLVEHLTFNSVLPDTSNEHLVKSSRYTYADFLTKFLNSRRQGTSLRTIEFYRGMLTPFVNTCEFTSEDINAFLSGLTCANGKIAYYRAIRAFCNWLYKQGHIKDNPITMVDPPKVKKIILPSLTPEQVDYLIDQVDAIRDKSIISLFADSGIRLSELLSIHENHIDWDSQVVIIWGKGGKQRKAPFTSRTAKLLIEYLRVSRVSQNMCVDVNVNIWGLRKRGIQMMLYRLEKDTGLPCNPHTFRRTFASNLHRAGLDVEHIMRLGGWESLDMVLRYTRSVKFEESLRLYREGKY